MATTEVGNVISSAIKGRKITGIVSGAPKAFYGIPAGTAFSAYPSSAGTAVVKISVSPIDACKADVIANDFTTGSAKWEDWTPGSVTAYDSSGADYDIVCAVCVVASGTWVFGVSK